MLKHEMISYARERHRLDDLYEAFQDDSKSDYEQYEVFCTLWEWTRDLLKDKHGVNDDGEK